MRPRPHAAAPIAVLAALLTIGIPCASRRAGGEKPRTLDEASFHSAVRPMLQRVGCANSSCHGSGFLAMPLLTKMRVDGVDLAEVRKATRIGDPDGSPVYAKAIGRAHLGGRNLAAESCEAKLLASWIRGERGLAPCPQPVVIKPSDSLPPALRERLDGCVTQACHGGRAMPRLLPPSNPNAPSVDANALRPWMDEFVPSGSKLLRAMLGQGGHPRSIGPAGSTVGGAASSALASDRAYLEMIAWMATGTGGGVLPTGPLPSFKAFTRDVTPILDRRGCTSGDCHGAKGVSLTLIPEAPIDNYVRLVARIAAGTFPAKPSNLMAHGGGKRIGDDSDCATTTINAWVAGHAPPRCKKTPLPDREVFETLVQPALETLTCPRCHARPGFDFLFAGHPSRAELARNYKEVLAHVDVEYPPASRVLLRVSEPCMQARMLAWVGRDPDPGCTVSLANFRGRFPGAPSPKTR